MIRRTGWQLPWRRLGWAFKGLSAFLSEPQNLFVHLPAAAIVLAVGCILQVDRVDWCLLVFAVGIVLVSEGLNSALESLADRLVLFESVTGGGPARYVERAAAAIG